MTGLEGIDEKLLEMGREVLAAFEEYTFFKFKFMHKTLTKGSDRGSYFYNKNYAGVKKSTVRIYFLKSKCEDEKKCQRLAMNMNTWADGRYKFMGIVSDSSDEKAENMVDLLKKYFKRTYRWCTILDITSSNPDAEGAEEQLEEIIEGLESKA